MAVFESKKPGHCSICDKDYPIGTRITKDKGGYVMADCKWPEHAHKNADPITQGAGKQAGRLAGGPVPADAEATTGSGMKKGEGVGSLSIQPASSLTDAQIEATIAWAEKKAAEHLNTELDYRIGSRKPTNFIRGMNARTFEDANSMDTFIFPFNSGQCFVCNDKGIHKQAMG